MRAPLDDAEITYGLRASMAVFARRPEAIRSIAYGASVANELAPLLRWASERGVACRVTDARSLEALCGTRQHEEAVIRAAPRRWVPWTELASTLARSRGAAIALDRVRNPYNIGAILRTAAFFGVDGVLLGALAPLPALPPDAVRVAEGGVEHLALTRTTDLADTLSRLRSRGVAVVGAENDGGVDALGYAFARPTVLVVGHERDGLSARVRAQCDALVAIRGSGTIDSLNVSVAASVMIAELTRSGRPDHIETRTTRAISGQKTT